MIGKGKAISHTRASMSYGLNQEKNAEVVFSQHLAGENPEQVTEEFRLVQEQNRRCQKNTFSFVLSPTLEEGRKLSKKQLSEITEKFLREMKLKENQAIAFVHRDRPHSHIHLYVNRISFNGTAVNDSFIGKRSQLAAETVAKEMGMTTARQVQMEKLLQSRQLRSEIKIIHDAVVKNRRPRSLDSYTNEMAKLKVKVIPTINKLNQLQGFRMEYKGHNFKASEVHRSMSGGRIMAQLEYGRNLDKKINDLPPLKLMGKTMGLSSGLVKSIIKNSIKKVLKRAIDTGIGY